MSGLVLQGTPEWKEARCGRVTASRIADVVAKTKTGWGAARGSYMGQLLAERLTGQPQDGFVIPAMRWGRECEDRARAAYEYWTDQDVASVGFVSYPATPMTGASPDGLVGDEGLVEIKCPTTVTHIDTLIGDEVPQKCLPQIQWQLACTGRQWCDFVSFDPPPREPAHLPSAGGARRRLHRRTRSPDWAVLARAGPEALGPLASQPLRGGRLMLRFTPKERKQAYACRDMVRRVRQRSRASPAAPARPFRGRQINKPHKAAVAQLFCLATYIRTAAEITGVHVAHLRFSNAAAGACNPGLQRKPDDCWVLPLSPNEHRRQHAMGEADYWAELGVDPHVVAAELWEASPDVEEMRQVLHQCRKNPAARRLPNRRSDDDAELARELQPALCTVIVTLLEDERCAIVSTRPVERYNALADDLERLGSHITIVARAMIAPRTERASAGEN